MQRKQLPVLLMSSSLLLLLLFLCFWLKNVYQKEYEGLQKEVNYVFSGSIRAIEDDILEKLIGTPRHAHGVAPLDQAVAQLQAELEGVILLLAQNAARAPVVPPMPGIDNHGVKRLRGLNIARPKNRIDQLRQVQNESIAWIARQNRLPHEPFSNAAFTVGPTRGQALTRPA